MFRLVVRKLLKIKWLAVCLIIGCSLAVSVLSSIPTYRDAVLQRMLTKDMEQTYSEKKLYPGVFQFDGRIYSGETAEMSGFDKYELYKSELEKTVYNRIDTPIVNSFERIRYGYLKAHRSSGANDPAEAFLYTQQGIEDHVEITAGRMFSQEKVDGVIEVIATQQALYKTKMILGAEYNLKTNKTAPGDIKVKVVGVFTMKKDDTVYWQSGLVGFEDGVVAPYALAAETEFMKSYKHLLTSFISCVNYDYKEIRVGDQLEEMLSAFSAAKKKFASVGSIINPALEIMEDYPARRSDMSLTIFLLQIPLILILLFYIFMVSKLTVNHDETEISVFKSRGSSRMQIVNLYLIQSGLLSAISLGIGIPLGMFICKVIGFSNGFLEFVNRKAIPLSFSWQATIYSVLAVLLFVVTTLIPAVIAAKVEIVKLKQKKIEKQKMAFWEKMGLDFILLLASLYGLYTYHARQKILLATGADAGTMAVDPLMFVMSTLFILGAGLLFLRVYPYILRGIFALGKKLWTPTLYASLTNVARSRGQDRFIMLFLIFSLSIGIFNATAARTMNLNEEEKVRYKTGADLVMGFEWYEVTNEYGEKTYSEPDMSLIRRVKGVQDTTRVMSNKDNTVYGMYSRRMENVPIMAVEKNFAEIAWWRDDIEGMQLKEMMELLKAKSGNVLLSSSLADQLRVKIGDKMNISIAGDQRREVYVAGFIDAFPTFFPSTATSKEGVSVANDLIVGNYHYLQSYDKVVPYEIWCKTDGETPSSEIYDSILENKIRLLSLDDTTQLIVKAKNDPMLQSVNGTLTMGFILTMLISMVGFLIFWILSIKGRQLQFGILRSIGLSKTKVIGMLVWDQLLISGAAIDIGVVIGKLVAALYVPVLQITSSASEQLPPFLISIFPSDYAKIFAVVAFIVVSGLLVLTTIVSRLNINQTLKMGED